MRKSARTHNKKRIEGMLTNDDGFWHQPNRKTAEQQEEECTVHGKKTISTDTETAINITDTQV